MVEDGSTVTVALVPEGPCVAIGPSLCLLWPRMHAHNGTPWPRMHNGTPWPSAASLCLRHSLLCPHLIRRRLRFQLLRLTTGLSGLCTDAARYVVGFYCFNHGPMTVCGGPSSLLHTRTWESNEVGHPANHCAGIAMAHESHRRHEAIRYPHLEI